MAPLPAGSVGHWVSVSICQQFGPFVTLFSLSVYHRGVLVCLSHCDSGLSVLGSVCQRVNLLVHCLASSSSVSVRIESQ